MEVPTEIVYNAIQDWKKSKIEPFTKAKLLKAYMEENNLSQRQAGEVLGMARGSIQNMLVFNRITKGQYTNFKEQGLSDDEIRKRQLLKPNYDSKDISNLDISIDKLILQLSKQEFITSKTLERANRLKLELDKFIIKIKKTNE